MTDSIQETETLLVQLLETLRTIKQTKEQYEYQTKSLQNFSDENERRNKLLQFSSQMQQTTEIFSNLNSECNFLYDEIDEMKENVLEKINEMQEEMEMKCNDIQRELNSLNISRQMNKPVSHIIYIRKVSSRRRRNYYYDDDDDEDEEKREKIPLNVNLSNTVQSIKSKIEQITNIDSCEQIIRFDGKGVDLYKSLAENGITFESTIDVSQREIKHERRKLVKPVILLYNENEIVNDEEVSIQLTLNDAMGIGRTYPHPSNEDESNKSKKEYEWKGKYSSNGSTNACQITINGKKYDYVFWEGECLEKEQFVGEIIGIESDTFEEEIDILLEKLGLNERERNDFIVYWLTKLQRNKYYKVTICNEIYDNEIAPLKVTGFSQIVRVMLKFEEITQEEVKELKRVDSVETRKRPTGKYVIEWGGILP